MKKTGLALILVLTMLSIMSLAAGPPLERFEELPPEMQAFRPEGFAFMDGILVEGGTAYLLFHDGNWYSLTILQQNQQGGWMRELSSKSALPPGNTRYSLSGDSSRHVYVTHTENEYYSFAKENGVWNLEAYFNATDETETAIYFRDGSIVYSDNRNQTQTTVRGAYQRGLRYLNILTLPFTVEQARKTLSNPPEMPMGGLQAQRVRFTSGQRFPVYTGPGINYHRPADGKAAVSTNDWIQVFGVENGWAMIQYDITSSHMRIGFIDASALPGNARVPDLSLSDQTKVLIQNSSLTDDPLFSRQTLIKLPTDTEVIYLDGLGTEWAYIETTVGQVPIRGFVPENSLAERPGLGLTLESTYNDLLIHEGLLQTINPSFYPNSEFFAEGHVVLGTKTKKSRMEVYLACGVGGYGFLDHAFVMQNGWKGACTAVLIQKSGEWTLSEILRVESNLDFPTIMPASAIEKYYSRTYDEDIQQQIYQQTQAYLDSIGRTEPIMDYSEIDVSLSGMLVVASNFRMYVDGDYPAGNTTMERLEGGVRYLYTRAWKPDEHGVIDPVYSTAHGEVHMGGTTGTETLTKVRKDDGALLETITIRVDLYELTISMEDAFGSMKYVFPFDGYEYQKPTITREGTCRVDHSRLDLAISELP